jgi:hypothetical protein
MKLHEIKVSEGLVDGTILQTIASITETGLTNGAQTVTLAKCILAIRDGKIGIANNFDAYLNQMTPDNRLIGDLKALSQGDAQKVASVVFQVLSMKNTQVASFVSPLRTIEDFILYATQASANE